MKKIKFYLALFGLTVLLTGCIRLQAGTWHQDADQNVTVRKVGIDTSKLIDGNQNQPSLTMPNEG